MVKKLTIKYFLTFFLGGRSECDKIGVPCYISKIVEKDPFKGFKGVKEMFYGQQLFLQRKRKY